jgi:hypothetical protein
MGFIIVCRQFLQNSTEIDVMVEFQGQCNKPTGWEKLMSTP